VVYIQDEETLKIVIWKMKFVFVYIALVFFTCYCEDKQVKAIAVLNDNDSVEQQPTGPLKTRLLIAKLDGNDTNQSSEALPAITTFKKKNTDEATTDNLGESSLTESMKSIYRLKYISSLKEIQIVMPVNVLSISVVHI
jgi:hypothetical protein